MYCSSKLTWWFVRQVLWLFLCLSEYTFGLHRWLNSTHRPSTTMTKESTPRHSINLHAIENDAYEHGEEQPSHCNGNGQIKITLDSCPTVPATETSLNTQPVISTSSVKLNRNENPDSTDPPTKSGKKPDRLDGKQASRFVPIHSLTHINRWVRVGRSICIVHVQCHRRWYSFFIRLPAQRNIGRIPREQGNDSLDWVFTNRLLLDHR